MPKAKIAKVKFEDAVSSLAFCLRHCSDEVLVDVCMKVRPATASDLIRLFTQRETGAWDDLDAETKLMNEVTAQEQASAVIQAFYDNEKKPRGGRG